jgi:hypothetical protein
MIQAGFLRSGGFQMTISRAGVLVTTSDGYSSGENRNLVDGSLRTRMRLIVDETRRGTRTRVLV